MPTNPDLGAKLDNIARNIEILNEAIIRLANNGEKRSNSPLSYNMSYSDMKNDIFRGRELTESRHNASDEEKRAYRDYIEKLKETLKDHIEEQKKLERNRDTRKHELNKKRKDIERQISEKERERRDWRDIRDNSNDREDIRDAEDQINYLTDDIEKLRKALKKIPDEINAVDKEIKKNQRIIDDTKGQLGKSKTYDEHAKNANEDRFRETARQAWESDEMTTERKSYYNNDFEKFVTAKKEQHAFNKRYDERQEAQRLIQNSGLENTAFGRITQKSLNRKQNFDNMQNFGRKMRSEGGAELLSKQLFGTSKGAKMATSAFKGLGGIMGKFGKLMGGPVVGGILMAIDALKALGKAIYDGVNEWAAINAEFKKYQTEQERIEYEKSKQLMIIDTQTEIEKITLAGDLAVKHTEMMSQNFLEGLSIQNEAFVKSMEIGTGAMTMGVAQTAYSAAEASIDQAAKMRKYEIHQGQRASSFELYRGQRELQAEGKMAGLQAERQVAEVQANVETLKNAQNINEYQANLLNQAGLSGSGVVKGIRAYSDVDNNTTTGVKGQGNVNPMSGENVQIRNSKDIIKEAESEMGHELHGKTSAGFGAVLGGDRHGFEAENRADIENLTQRHTQAVDAMKTKTELYYNKATTQMEYQTQLSQQVVDTTAQAKEAVIDAAAAVEKNWLKTTQAMEEWLRKYDERMNDVGLNIGIWTKESMSAFKEGHLQTVKYIAQKYGKSEEQIAQYQTTYADTSGRNKLLAGNDLGKTAALGTFVGDDAAVAKYISEMEFFNQSAADAAETIFEDMKNVNKLGLNARKYMKDVTANLKLANKYNFKEGTKSLREMVKWAQQTKFNMQSLGGMLEKVQEGGLEGVIQQSAGFQVLGGMAAINSDPFGMMYEAWADPQAYAKRMQDMTKGFGTFNKKTGETEFNMPESMQIAQIAKLQGRSPEELREEIARRNQTREIKKQIRPDQNLTEDQVQYLSNAATFDKETGQWKVNMMNKETGEIKPMNLSDINSGNIGDFTAISENHDEKMEQMVGELVSLVAKERGEQTFELADQAAMDYKNTMQNLNDRLEKIHNSYIQQRESIHNEIVKKQEEIRDNTKNFLEQFATNINDDTSAISKETEKIRQKTDAIGDALGSIAQTVNDANAAINKSISEKLGQFNGNAESAANNASATISSNGGNGTRENSNVKTPDSKAMSIVKTYMLNGGSKSDLNKYISNYEEYVKGNKGNNNEKFYHEVLSKGTTGTWMDRIRDNAMTNKSSFRDKNIWKDLNQEMGQEGVNALLEEIYNAAKTYQKGNVNDGFAKAGDNPMMINADKATPINDGFVKFKRTDTIMAGEPKGIFDKLFDNIFGKINAVYDEMNGLRKFNIVERIEQYAKERKSSLPKSFDKEAWEDPSGYNKRFNNDGFKRDVNVNINGKLTLDSGNQSIDLMELLRNNPDLVRKITETIVLQLSSNENGGKHDMFSNRYYR